MTSQTHKTVPVTSTVSEEPKLETSAAERQQWFSSEATYLHKKWVKRLVRDIDALLAENRRLRSGTGEQERILRVLEPFAALGAKADAFHPHKRLEDSYIANWLPVTVGDLRAAAALHKDLSQKGE